MVIREEEVLEKMGIQERTKHLSYWYLSFPYCFCVFDLILFVVILVSCDLVDISIVHLNN